MASAVALHECGFEVEIFEARRQLGGRAGSIQFADGREWIDPGQHILLGCCRNLLDFYRRLGVEHLIRFHDRFVFVEPGGRRSTLPAADSSPSLLIGFLRLRFLGLRDKMAILRALAAVRRELAHRHDLNALSMGDWLAARWQTRRALARFWRPVIVSALNEELERVSAWHGLQVLWLVFLAGRGGARLGVPAVPLAELYREENWRPFSRIRLRLGARVERIHVEADQVRSVEANGGTHKADVYVLATTPDRARGLVPDLGLPSFESSPIAAIHLWFDQPVMDLPQAALLDRTIQWAFNKREGRYVQLVVSAASSLVSLPGDAVLALALRELAEFFPRVKAARLEDSLVVREVHATFPPLPGLRSRRPGARTRLPNLYLAGDWTDTGWPATMESAVRSGYLAAEAIAYAFSGVPQRFLIPDPRP